MTALPYISIKSVLYDLSRLLPESQWNEIDFLEWANKGLRRVKIYNKLQTKVTYIILSGHKATLPSDMRYLNQVAYKKYSQIDSEDLSDIQDIINIGPTTLHVHDVEGLATRIAEAATVRFAWRPMKVTTNLFMSAITCSPELFPTLTDRISTDLCDEHEYFVDASGIITSTLDEGVLVVSYLRFPKDDDCDVLIPDNETLKEALVNYCLWMYYTKKDIMGESGADKKMSYYKQMFGLMAQKAAGELNDPDISQMENIKNMMTRLVPRSNQYDNMFSKLNNKENLTW